MPDRVLNCLLSLFLGLSPLEIRLTFYQSAGKGINSLPKDEILDWSELEARTQFNFNVAKLMTLVFNRVENKVEKRENTDYQHFLLFPQYFQKASFLGSFKLGIV